MEVTQYLDVINCNLIITYYHNQDNRWCASFEYAEIIDYPGSCMLISSHGKGSSPKNAITDYLEQIKGKTIVFNAISSDKRREFVVPKNITFIE